MIPHLLAPSPLSSGEGAGGAARQRMRWEVEKVAVSTPRTIAVIGATGYIGGRLSRLLLDQGREVRVIGRRRSKLSPLEKLGAQIAVADVSSYDAIRAALDGVDHAYYLVHSMDAGGDFVAHDRHCAQVVARAASDSGLQRIVYLGGLGDSRGKLSEHLASRQEVARILETGAVPVTVLRAGVIVGGGSASYRMIRDLVNRLPVMVCPRWVRTRCQPIAVDDALAYLAGCLDHPETAGQRYDIGGPNVLSYERMMLLYARAAGRTRVILPVPVLTPRLSSYWVDVVTSVPGSVARPLIEGVVAPAICQEDRIRTIMTVRLQSYQAAVRSIMDGSANA